MLAQLPAGFVQRQVASNLNPTTLVFSPNGRLFVVEKDGKIREVINDVLAPDPLLTIPNVDVANERGLLGLCFHPDFPQKPYFYVYYTVKNQNHNRLSRFQLVNGVADVKTETVLLDLDPLPGTVHNAGALRFGPDRKLYVGIGDGTNAAAAQQLTSFLGKILRLNEDGSIPADNPFVNQTKAPYSAIYALGLRNPFSMDINPVSGQFLVGDVGGDSFEEINDIRAGQNYGWPLIEGYRTNQSAPEHYVDPIYAYNHNTGCAITGLATYNPSTIRFPDEYKGRVFFSDYCEGSIHILDPANGQIIATFLKDIDRPLTIATSPDGYLYYVARGGMGGGSQQDNTSSWNGSLYKVSFFDSGKPYISTQSSGKLVPVGESVTFTVDAVGQKPLTYQWYQNDKPIAGANQANFLLNSPTLADNNTTFHCIVSNGLGNDTSKKIPLQVVQAQRPIARIRQPVTNTMYRGGDLIMFVGDALTTNQQTLANAKMTWWIDFHHDDHVHPALDPVSGTNTGSYRVPRVGETSTAVWYRVHLLVTDVSGLASETFVDVKPEIATISIASSLPGVRVYVDGAPKDGYVTFDAVVGMLRSLETKPYLATPEGFYKFLGWGNGQNASLVTYEVVAGGGKLDMKYEALPASSGNGLWGEYFKESREISGTPTLSRVDERIDFDWAENEPASGIGSENFTVRWTGKLKAPLTDTYSFFTETDDGTRLWINNKLLVDHWTQQPSMEWLGQVDLVEGQLYDIRMEYFESEGYANARLFWSSPQFERAVIAKPYLFNNETITSVKPDIESSLTVFPIPSRDKITVRYVATTSGTAQLEITDLLGRHVVERPVRFLVGQNDYELEVTDWSAGMYMINLKPADQSAIYQRILIR
ncbi:PQQ-dependent sugar dehydrogenase [Spirosoma daeguense]